MSNTEMEQASTGQPVRRQHQRFVPNVPVVTHESREALFYDDLVKERLVIVNFMSVANHARYPVAPALAQVNRLLKRRDDLDAHIYSITVDPQNDTPDALAGFAARFGAGGPWQFVTGDEAAVMALRRAFFVHRAPEAEAGGISRRAFLDFVQNEFGGGTGGAICAQPDEDAPDCTMGLMRYGNDALDIWGSVPVRADPRMIVERLSWIAGRRVRQTGRITRGGPGLLTS